MRPGGLHQEFVFSCAPIAVQRESIGKKLQAAEILQQVVDEFFSGGGLFLFDSVDESDSLNDVG
jgi:hypothetical protein